MPTRLMKPVRPLTPIQCDVVDHVRRGQTPSQIADEMELEERTVTRYIRDISWLLPDTDDNPHNLPHLRRVERWALLTGWSNVA